MVLQNAVFLISNIFILLYNSHKSKNNDENLTLPMSTSHDHYGAESNYCHRYKPLETDHSYFVQLQQKIQLFPSNES